MYNRDTIFDSIFNDSSVPVMNILDLDRDTGNVRAGTPARFMGWVQKSWVAVWVLLSTLEKLENNGGGVRDTGVSNMSTSDQTFR